jgi:hypothetical protein
MKKCEIIIEYPDRYSNNEVVNAILGQLDIDSFNRLGIKIYIPKEYSWFY